MNASPLASPRASSDSTPEISTAVPPAPARKRSLRSLLGTITGICFVFGGLAAVQVRSIKNMEKARVDKSKSDDVQKRIAVKNQAEAAKSAKKAEGERLRLEAVVATLRSQGNLSATQLKTLTAQIKSLQMQACLTTVTGPGIRIVLSDNQQTAQAGGNPSLPYPGLVHDFDVLQVVNELRVAKADAIAIHGAGGEVMRITGATPIRCVGSVIQVNWNPVAAPFTIEAIGNPKTLGSAMNISGGIVENLRVQGAIGVKVTTQDSITMPPTDISLATPSTSNVTASRTVPDANSKGL